jgi:hypothetical protein
MKLLASLALAALAAQSVAHAQGHEHDRGGPQRAAPAYLQQWDGHEERGHHDGAWRSYDDRRFAGAGDAGFRPYGLQLAAPRWYTERDYRDHYWRNHYRPYRYIDPWTGAIVIRLGD